MDNTISADEIKEFRLSLKLTQEQFAQCVGTTVVSINRWEAGKCKVSKAYERVIRRMIAENILSKKG